ncbi:MAG: hypothetical protein WAV95_19820 [Azonexus sp.]
MKNTHPLAGALALLAFCLGQTPAMACEPDESAAPLHLAAESPVRQKTGLQVGEGPHSYRFVVRDPQHIERPYRNGRYQIEIKGDANFPDGTRFYRGTTDGQGRTASFRFAQPLPVANWVVQPLSGQGELGESFRLTSDSCQYDLSNYPYMINSELGPVFCGHALPGGLTIRYMMPLATSVQLDSSISASGCLALQRRVNPVMARANPASRIAGLQQLRRDRKLAEHEELLQAKIEAQVLRHGSLEQVKAMVKRKLAEAGEAPADQANVYNNVGYDLAEQNPPRHLAYANDLLDKSLSLEQTLFNIDSKAWALNQAGHYAEALDQVNRAIALYATQCTESEKNSYPEALAHRGMILWTMKQPGAALTDWAKADISNSGGGWANFIPPWKNIQPLIALRVAELQAAGFKETLCSEIKAE